MVVEHEGVKGWAASAAKTLKLKNWMNNFSDVTIQCTSRLEMF